MMKESLVWAAVMSEGTEKEKSAEPSVQETWERLSNDQSLSPEAKARALVKAFPDRTKRDLGKTIGEKSFNKFFLKEESKAKIRRHQEALREERRTFRTELKLRYGGKCLLCGYSDSMVALDFHHTDPTSKEKDISSMYSKQEMEEEAKKCVLLCANCHRRAHAGEVKIP